MIKRTYLIWEICSLYFLLCGGNVGESNPPNPLTDIGHRIGYIDFEDQEGHQASSAPIVLFIFLLSLYVLIYRQYYILLSLRYIL